VSYRELAESESPSLTTAFVLVGADWAGKIISVGILIGLTSVLMVLLLGLMFLVMFGDVHRLINGKALLP